MNISDFSVFPMQWGVKPAEPTELIDLAIHAEELGFYSFTIPHVPILPHGQERPGIGPVMAVWSGIPTEYQDYQYDILVLLPMLAQATSTIMVGSNVLVTPWTHPFVWAKYLASLDAASGGRVIAGFGLGFAAGPGEPIKALDSFGIDGTRRGKMSDEALDFITSLWTADELVSFDGEFYKGVDLAISPKPVQKPYPEIWWAGLAKPSIRRAAQYGGMLEVSYSTVQDVRERLAPGLAAANEKYGGTARLGLHLYGDIRSDGDLSPEDMDRHFYRLEGDGLESVAAGSPETCAEVFRRYHHAGVDHFVLDFHRHGLDHVDTIHGQMERFATEVVPLLR